MISQCQAVLKYRFANFKKLYKNLIQIKVIMLSSRAINALNGISTI